MEKKRYLAFFDIMGFKSWVQTKGSLEVFKYMRGYFNLNIRASLPGSVVNENMTVNISKAKLGYANFSDSVIFYSNNNGYKSFESIIQTSAFFLSVLICGNSRLVRGGISEGEFYVDKKNNMYIGQALIDAYGIESNLEVFTAGIDRKILETDNFKRFSKANPGILRECQAKAKDGQAYHCLDFSNEEFTQASFDAVGGLREGEKECLALLKNGDEREIDKLRRRVQWTQDFLENKGV